MSLRISSAASPNAMIDMEGPARRLAGAVERLAEGFGMGLCADRAGMAIERLLQGEAGHRGQALESACAAYNLSEAVAEALTDVQGLLERVRSLTEEWQCGALPSAADRRSMRVAIEQLAFEVEYVGAQADFKARRLESTVVALNCQVGVVGHDGAPRNRTASESTEPTGTGGADVFELDAAIAQLASQRVIAGSVQHRLEFVVNQLARHKHELVGSERLIRASTLTASSAAGAGRQDGHHADSAVLAQPEAVPQGLLTTLRD